MAQEQRKSRRQARRPVIAAAAVPVTVRVAQRRSVATLELAAIESARSGRRRIFHFTATPPAGFGPLPRRIATRRDDDHETGRAHRRPVFHTGESPATERIILSRSAVPVDDWAECGSLVEGRASRRAQYATGLDSIPFTRSRFAKPIEDWTEYGKLIEARAMRRRVYQTGLEPELDTVDVYIELLGSPAYITFKGNAEARAELLGNAEARAILRGAP